MLAVVADAFEAAGCQVIGTATSGQAARNLGDAADIDTSRTLASLRVASRPRRLTLDSRTVVILDEAGMTDDPDFVGLALRVEAAGAKLVIVGDDRQLGSVGPGGAMGALMGRHPDAVQVLADNHRQIDPAEQTALEQLRAGNIAAAVDWYDRHGRIHCRPERDEALDRAVEGWAADIEVGQDAGLYAYQRGNVAALNARAREWMADTGRLFGPEVAGFRAGDRVVTTSPVPGAAGHLGEGHRSGRPRTGRSGRLCGPTTAVSSASPPTSSASWTTGTPPPCTAPKAPPSTGPTSTPTAAAESSPTWP